MVKFQFSKQKTKSAEKISQQVFYIMIGLAGYLCKNTLNILLLPINLFYSMKKIWKKNFNLVSLQSY